MHPPCDVLAFVPLLWSVASSLACCGCVSGQTNWAKLRRLPSLPNVPPALMEPPPPRLEPFLQLCRGV